MNTTTLKWILSGAVPAFAVGSSLLISNPTPNFAFWWAVAGAFLGGLAGKGINGGIDTRNTR